MTTIEGRLPELYFAFAIHGGSSVGILFIPNQLPRTILAGVFTKDFVGAIMVGQTGFEIIRVANIKLSGRILKNVTPEHALIPLVLIYSKVGSGGRIRTYDQVINSHLRYHCATPEP